MPSNTTAIILHGGAWSIPEVHEPQTAEGIRQAALAGYRVLEDGGSAVDGVEAAVTALENWKYFNAGYGSCLNSDGDVEMDAIIMNGEDLNSGAVAAVKCIKNPVKLARLVMDKTYHTLIVGDGALRAARELGAEVVENKELVVDHERDEFTKFKFTETRDILYRGAHEAPNFMLDHDTVGACALDAAGHVAFATSTGGLTAKLPGRVGDSPLVGCGGYADDAIGAVSCTGHGESITKVVLAHRILNHVQQGLPIQAATARGLEYMRSRLSRYGGAVSVDACGNFGRYFTSEKMAWATVKDGVMNYGIRPGEDFMQKVE